MRFVPQYGRNLISAFLVMSYDTCSHFLSLGLAMVVLTLCTLLSMIHPLVASFRVCRP